MNLINDLIDKIIDTSSVDGRLKLVGRITDKESIKKIFVIGFFIITFITNFLVESFDTAIGIFNEDKFNVLMVFIPRIFSYFPVYLIAYLLFFIIYYKSMLKIKVAFGKLENNQKGSSRFSTWEEVDQQYKSIPKKDLNYEGNGGIPIARNLYKDEIYIDDSPVNNLIIGMTRSGKGEMIVFSMIDAYSRAGSMASLIINDPKGELVGASKETLEERGFEVFVLNLEDPLNSICYNLLQLIKDSYKKGNYSQAQLLCNNLTKTLYHNPNSKDPFWEQCSMSLVNALILAVCDKYIDTDKEYKVTMYTVADMLATLGSKDYEDDDGNKSNALDDYFKNLPDHSVAKKQYATSNFAKGNTRNSIFTSAMSELNIFTLEEIAKMTSKNTLDLKSIGFNTNTNNKPKAVFMVTPDYDSSNHKIVSIFIDQLYYVLSKQSTIGNGKCDREVVFLLDEFGNLPTINDMANKLTVCLGRNIKFNIVIQAYQQLEKLYGKDASTIEGNCGNQIYILSNDKDTREKFSTLLGNETQIIYSRSGNLLDSNRSHTESLDKKRLLNAEDLKLKEGEMIVARVIKRRDLVGNKITPFPIFNNNEHAMEYRYEYLSDTFDTNKKIKDIKIESIHRDVNLKDLLFTDEVIEKEYINEREEHLSRIETLVKEEINNIEDTEEISVDNESNTNPVKINIDKNKKITQMQKFKIIKLCDNLPTWHLDKIKDLDTFNEIKKYLTDIGENRLYNEVSKMECSDIKDQRDIYI